MREQLGKYTLLKLLATGGMAEIWLARQTGLEGFEKLVVIKRILPHLSNNSEFVSMFLDEARLAAQLSHPHIVQIFELGRINGTYFIAMEFVHGENLRVLNRTAVKAGKGFPPDYSAKVISQASDALHYAHTKTDVMGNPLGLVHRDISPQNIILSFDGQTKVVDFGIAKAASKYEETRTGVLKGKYSYMSPEQCKGEKVDHRSDIFSLGIVLWELLTGARLFKLPGDLLILKAICERPAPPPSLLKPVSPELDAIVLKALSKKPANRFQSCHEMHLAIENYLRKRETQISPLLLAEEMQSLFSPKLNEWKRLVDNLQSREDDLDTGFLKDLSGLIGAKTGTGLIRDEPGTSSSGSKPLFSGGEDRESYQPDPNKMKFPVYKPQKVTESEKGEEKKTELPPKKSINIPSSIKSAPVIWISALAVLCAGLLLTWYLVKPEKEEIIPPLEEVAPVIITTGTLFVESAPAGAEVYLDDEMKGITPLLLKEIPPGKIKLRLESETYKSWSSEVEIDKPDSEKRVMAILLPSTDLHTLEIITDPEGASVFLNNSILEDKTPTAIKYDPEKEGQEIRVEKKGYTPEIKILETSSEKKLEDKWVLKLDPKKVSPPLVMLPPDPAPEPGQPKTYIPSKSAGKEHGPRTKNYPSKRPRKSASDSEELFGLLSVNARPWCNVSMDGRELGQTPLVNIQVPAGRHDILCANPHSGVSRTVTVNIPAGGRVRETINLGMGHLDVRVNPWAEVTVDGHSLGTTPFKPQQLPEGNYTVVLSNPGFNFRKEYSIHIKADETHTIRENLIE